MDGLEQKQFAEYQQAIIHAKQEIGRVIVGLNSVIDQVMTAILCNGHVLLEGVPGLGKTMLVHSIGQVFDLKFTRIQFTPDLMPADITGTNILMEDTNGRRYFQFQPGPLFGQIVLADEINRATAKTQSALLEAMQERSITIAGETRYLEQPFFVLATQNPLELEGTYPLPEAQLDRFFFKVKVGYPSFEELRDILLKTTIGEEASLTKMFDGDALLQLQALVRQMPVSHEVLTYAARIILATHPHAEANITAVKDYVRYGASPRGGQTLILAGKAKAFMEGRFTVSFADVRAVALPALRHRILLNFEGEATEQDMDQLIHEIIAKVPESV